MDDHDDGDGHDDQPTKDGETKPIIGRVCILSGTNDDAAREVCMMCDGMPTPMDHYPQLGTTPPPSEL